MHYLYSILAFLFHTQLLWAQDIPSNCSPHAEFAGIWFYSSIDKESIKKQFPVGHQYGPSASQEVGKDHVSDLYLPMKTALLKQHKKDGKRILDYMPQEDDADFANSDQQDSIVFACALNYEHTEDQYESGADGSYSKVLAEIGFDLVICNFKDRRILATLPARIIAIDAVNGKASTAHKQAMLRKLYNQSLIPKFVELAKTSYSSSISSKTLGINNIRVDADALKNLPNNYKENGERAYKSYLSSIISSSFYSAVKVPVLPYSGGGEKIFYVMSERIKDTGRVLDEAMKDTAMSDKVVEKDFLLKKPDYSMDIVFPGFLTHTLQKNQYQKQLAFISYCGIIIREGDKEIFKNKYKDSVTATYPNNIKLNSSWINYEDASIIMLRSAAKSLKNHKKTSHIIKKSSIQ